MNCFFKCDMISGTFLLQFITNYYCNNYKFITSWLVCYSKKQKLRYCDHQSYCRCRDCQHSQSVFSKVYDRGALTYARSALVNNRIIALTVIQLLSTFQFLSG